MADGSRDWGAKEDGELEIVKAKHRKTRDLGPVACETHLFPNPFLECLFFVPPKILGVELPTSFSIAFSLLLLTRVFLCPGFIE